ncbi:MAG: WbuC family cupin fold metalloprotein [Magnetospirillum sp.]|nr:WbuC family cupin fold metalloprotein [Magnetospirillum sp.]
MKVIDGGKVAALKATAAAALRLRTHANLHDDLSDPVQRVVIALEPGTYVRPHRHNEGVWELFALLDGALAVLVFDVDGIVRERVELRPGGNRLVQLPPDTWHSLVALESGTLALEVKPGPYVPSTDKNFAAWAPAEGEAGAAGMVRWYEGAAVGAGPPARRPSG